MSLTHPLGLFKATRQTTHDGLSGSKRSNQATKEQLYDRNENSYTLSHHPESSILTADLDWVRQLPCHPHILHCSSSPIISLTELKFMCSLFIWRSIWKGPTRRNWLQKIGTFRALTWLRLWICWVLVYQNITSHYRFRNYSYSL